ncbi:hypothetical protein M514_22717 [Trichuris suis]|uniref:Uncharacterized protein n=1 Tax=Trichuris suis TaxID=68888 RepID=A0A085N6P1_9BILA|nr:hypothetical protein M514_22717 [Trichuris suis]
MHKLVERHFSGLKHVTAIMAAMASNKKKIILERNYWNCLSPKQRAEQVKQRTNVSELLTRFFTSR